MNLIISKQAYCTGCIRSINYLNYAGRAHIARHGRRNDECNAIEELRPIDDNELYSSTYQVHCDANIKYFNLGFLTIYIIQTYSILHEPVTVRKVL